MPLEAPQGINGREGINNLPRHDVLKQPDSVVIIAKPEVLPKTPPIITVEPISPVVPTLETDLFVLISDRASVSRTKSNGEIPSNLSNKLTHDSIVSLTLSRSRDRKNYLKDHLSKHRSGRGRRSRSVCPKCQRSYHSFEGHQCRGKNLDSNPFSLPLKGA